MQRFILDVGIVRRVHACVLECVCDESEACDKNPIISDSTLLSAVVSDKVVYWFGVYFWFGRFRSVQVVSSIRVYIDGRGIRIHSRT